MRLETYTHVCETLSSYYLFFSIFQDSCKRQTCDMELSWMSVQGGAQRSLPLDAVPLAYQRMISPTILFDLFFCL